MERHQLLFIYIISIIIFYMIMVRIPVLPPSIGDIPTKKMLKGTLGIVAGAGALIIYLKHKTR